MLSHGAVASGTLKFVSLTTEVLLDHQPPSRKAGLTPLWVGLSLGMLISCNFVNWMDRQVLSAVVPSVRDEFLKGNDHAVPAILHWLHPGQDPQNAALGMLVLCFMGAYMLLAPIFGILPFKRWHIIGGGIILWSLATGMSGLAGTFGMLLFSRFLVGVGEAAYGPLAPAMIADLYPKEKRGTMMALFMLAVPCGSALGYILGGAVDAMLGWRWAFYLPVVPGLILGGLCFMMPEPARQDKQSRKVSLKEVPILLKTPSFLYAMAAMTAMTFCIGALGYWMPSYVHEYRQAGSLAAVNVIFGGMILVTGIGATFAGGYLADKLRPRYNGIDFLLPAAALVIGLPLFLLALYTPFPFAWLLIAATCAVLFAGGAPMNTIIANVVPSSMRAIAYGLNILVIHLLGDAISPMIVGAAADGSGMHIAFMSLSVVVALAIVFCFLGSKHIVKDMTLAAEKENKA